MKKPRGPQGKRGHSAQYSLEPNQVQAVMKACENLEDRVIIGAMIYCGLRTGEVGHMKYSWITQDGALRIPASQRCECQACSLKSGYWRPKTKSGARELHIPNVIERDVKTFLSKNPNGLQLSRQAIYHRVKDILRRAGVKQKGLAGDTGFSHALRSTYATQLALGGIDAVSLCYAMGWSSIKVAESYIQAVKAQKSSQQRVKDILG